MNRRYLDLLVVIILSFLTLLLILTSQGGLLQAVFGSLLTLVLPGYALLTAIFGFKLPGITERVTLTIGLSLVELALSAFVLNFLPGGLQTSYWAIWQTGICVGASLVALLHRLVQGSGNSAVLQPVSFQLSLRPAQSFFFSLALLIACAALWLAYDGAQNQNYGGFTQLWLLKGESQELKFGFTNAESSVVAYRLELKADDRLIQQWSKLELKPGEKWESSTTLSQNPALANGKPAQVEASLFRLDKPATVYRQVVWQNTGEGR